MNIFHVSLFKESSVKPVLFFRNEFNLTWVLGNGTIVHMSIVADTNIFLATALNEPEKNAIISATGGHDLIAPEILPFEAGNALSAMVKRKRLSREDALLAFEEILKVPVELKRIDIGKALAMATKTGIYAYDAYFLQCADAFHAPLLTLDGAMKKIAGELGIKLLEVES